MPEILSLLGMLVIVAGVLVMAYFFTRYVAARGMAGYPAIRGQKLKVLDQMSLGRDQRLLVIQAGERFFLVGAAATGFTMLAELTGQEAEQWTDKGESGEPLPSFKEAFLAQLKKKK